MTVLDSGWKRSWLAVVWEALEEHDYPEEQWDDICTAMAWIREELGLPSEVEDEGR